MRSKEFLKALLKSLKSGRLHRVLKALLVLLFLFFSYQVSISVLKYWVKEREELSIVRKNFHWSFNWKRGELSLKADYLFVENPKFSCELFKPELDVDVYKSLRELRPIVSFFGLSEGRVVLKKKKGEGKKLNLELPFLLEKADIGRVTFQWAGGYAVLNRFVYSEKEFYCGGVNGEFRGQEFYVEPFTGVRSDGYFFVPNFSFGYRGSKVFGRLKVYSLGKWEFSGSCVSSYFGGKLNVKYYGKLIRVNWNGRVKNVDTKGTGTVRFKGKGVVLEEVSGRFDGAEFLLHGEIGKGIDLRGRVQSRRFLYQKYGAEGVNIRFSISGKLEDPKVQITGRVKSLKTPQIELRNLRITGVTDRESGKIWWSSQNLDGVISLNWKGRQGKGTIILKHFSIKEITAVRVYSRKKKYRNWIPDLALSGDLKFQLEKNRVEYKGDLNVEKFSFQGFKAHGTVRIKGNSEKLSLEGKLLGKDGGTVRGETDVFLKKREMRGDYAVEDIPAEDFKFLKKVGLAGKVGGTGRVWGSFKNPQADFSVSSENLKFKGVRLGRAAGEVKLKDFILYVSAVTDRGTLDELTLKLRGKRELSAKGEVKDVSGKEIEEVLKGFRVKVPFGIEGLGSGSFSIYSEDLKEKKALQVEILIDRFYGVFSYKGLTARGDGEGRIEYRGGNLNVKVSGNLERAQFRGKVLTGGKYSVVLNGGELSVVLQGSRYESGFPELENSVSGSLSINLKTGQLGGRGKVSGRYLLKGTGEIVGDVDYFVSGELSNFTVKISGKLNLTSKLTGKEKLEISGALLEPDNLGTISIRGKDTDLKVIANGKSWQAVGFIRNLNVKTQQLKVRINMAFVNVNLLNLTGTVAVPTFKVYPKGFYPMYAVSGVYVELKNGEPSVSDVTLSYVDGWIKLKNLKLNRERKSLTGEIEASVGAKGLVYIAGAQKFIPYVRNSFSVEGSFRYSGELHYRITVDGTGVELRAKYLLDRAVVNRFKAVVENGSLEKVNGNISIGSGSLLINGKEKSITATASLIPVGEVGKWKGLISGKVGYSGEGIRGTLTVSKAKLFLGKAKAKEKKERGAPPKLPVKLSVNLLFDQPLKIKGELFSLTLIPKLWIRTVNGRVVIGGTFYVTDGKINYMGKEFKVIYGTGTIEDLEKEKGRVNILASDYVSGYYIYMKIEGELNNLTIYLSSDPPLTREQILNLIMTGASPEEIEASSELFPAVQVAYYATASLFKPIESKFKKGLKLESFSIEPYITKYGETVAKLTVAKRLAERIRLVGYGTTGQNPEYGGSVQLFIKKNYYLELRYNSYYGLEAGVGLEVNKR